MSVRLQVAPGVFHFPEYFTQEEQKALFAEILSRVTDAPFYRPTMPRSGLPMSVEMTNFGPLGWVTDAAKGYRYEPFHPITGRPWPAIPETLLKLWTKATEYPEAPEACLVNFYRADARMGLHRDQDEEALDAPVLSVSLGDTGVFRFGASSRSTATLKLCSGDVLVFGGPARLMYHGIGRILSGSSTLLTKGGRINLTLRRVTKKKGDRSGG